MFKAEEDCIHGRDMVEDFHLSHQAIKIAKRTGWGANTEMQVFAVGVQRGMDEVNRQIAGKDIQISGMETEIKILNEKLTKYKQVLEFYGNRSSWTWIKGQEQVADGITISDVSGYETVGIELCGGRRAREALNDLRKGGE